MPIGVGDYGVSALGQLPPIGTAGFPWAQTFDRRLCTGVGFQTTSGTLTMTAIWLPEGATVTGITFVSGATAESGGTNLWYALFNLDLTLLAQSTNDTGAAAFAANTALRKALTTPQKLTRSGFYYIGYMSSNSAGAQPTLAVYTCGSVNLTGNITGMTPIVAGTSSTGQTTTAPNPAAALTAIAACLYAFVD